MKVVKISFIDKEKQKKNKKIIDKLKAKDRNYSKYIDGFILFMIVFTSLPIYGNWGLITVPIFFTVIFILIQVKRLVSKKVELKK